MTAFNINFLPLKSPGIISAKLWVREGSRADPENRKGIHQLLTSLLSRGCGPYDNLIVGDIVEGFGAGLRADTYEDGILLSLKCNAKDIFSLLPILGWMICQPHLSIDQINLEKELTIQALQRQKEHPFNIAFDGWRRIAYFNSGYEHDPLGIKKDIGNIYRDDLLNLLQEINIREKILVIAGSLPNNLEKTIKEVKPFKILSKQECKFPKNKNIKNQENIYSPYQKSHSLHFQNTQQVIIIIGKPTIPHGHIDDIILRLIGCHIGVGMSSVLFKSLREKHGVAYEVGVYNPIREGNSPFIIHASTTEEKASLTLKLLKECWNSIIDKKISEKDLDLAKGKFKGQIAHSLQSISQQAERKVHLLGLRLEEDLDNIYLTRMNSITSSEIQKCAKDHLRNPLLSICGPRKTLEKLSNKINIK